MASHPSIGVWPERFPQKPSREDGHDKGKLRGGPAGWESTEADPRQSAVHPLSLQVHLACCHTQRCLLPVQPPHHWLLPAGGVGWCHRSARGWDHRSDSNAVNTASPAGEFKLISVIWRSLFCADYIRTFTWDKKLEMVVKSTGILGGQGESDFCISFLPHLAKNKNCKKGGLYQLNA